jgi:hypothetical protein
MRELNQNENLILIEENEMNIEKYVERKKMEMCKQKTTMLKKMGNK